MKWVAVTGSATVLCALLGWVSFGHLAALLGLEILTSLWFARLRTRVSLGPVTNPHAKRQAYTVTIERREVARVFDPVQGQPLTTEDRLWLANHNAIVLGVGGGMSIFFGLMADPAFFTPTQLLILGLLAASMMVTESRRHADWVASGAWRMADPTLQMHHENWRVAVFVGFMMSMLLFFALPRLLAVAFAVALLATDLALHGKREKWTGEITPAPDPADWPDEVAG